MFPPWLTFHSTGTLFYVFRCCMCMLSAFPLDHRCYPSIIQSVHPHAIIPPLFCFELPPSLALRQFPSFSQSPFGIPGCCIIISISPFIINLCKTMHTRTPICANIVSRLSDLTGDSHRVPRRRPGSGALLMTRADTLSNLEARTNRHRVRNVHSGGILPKSEGQIFRMNERFT